MRWCAGLVFLAGCATAKAPLTTVDLGPVPRVVEEARAAPVFDPRPTFPTRAGDTAWIEALPRAKRFAVIDELASARTIGITWRQYPQRTPEELEAHPDEPGLLDGPVELVLDGDGVTRTIDLGRESGHVEGGMTTACQRAGWRHAKETTWAYEELPNRVAFWEIGTMAGSTEYLVLLGPDRLHVLYRQTHDGACPATVSQGPMQDICEDMQWERFLELPVRGAPNVRETSVHVDAAGGNAEPLDCQASYTGEDLVRE